METILVQETDSATLEVLTVALEMKGYKVRSLFDQRENALHMIKRRRPKMVLLNCWLSHSLYLCPCSTSLLRSTVCEA